MSVALKWMCFQEYLLLVRLGCPVCIVFKWINYNCYHTKKKKSMHLCLYCIVRLLYPCYNLIFVRKYICLNFIFIKLVSAWKTIILRFFHTLVFIFSPYNINFNSSLIPFVCRLKILTLLSVCFIELTVICAWINLASKKKSDIPH